MDQAAHAAWPPKPPACGGALREPPAQPLAPAPVGTASRPAGDAAPRGGEPQEGTAALRPTARHPHPRTRCPAALARLHETLLRHAAAVLSGPGGLAAFLRTRLTGDQFPSVSLPLDTGTPASLITGGLRRAVIARDRHCAFPGCDQPPAACQVHHLKPKAPTAARPSSPTWSCSARSTT